MKLVFFGTPDFVLPILNALHKEYRTPDGLTPFEAVVTQPPRPVGRKKEMNYSAVDTWAHKKNERIKYDSSKIKILHSPDDLLKLGQIDSKIGILAAYGAIIPKEVINLFPLGILNIHPSKLPELRGASPIQAAIAMGKTETGITIMKMDEKLDHGPVLTQSTEEIFPDDTNETLTKRLFEKSAAMLIEMLPAYTGGKIKLKPQDHDKATFTTLLKKEHGFIPWDVIDATLKGSTLKGDLNIPYIKDYSLVPSPLSLYNLIRALHPWPGVWTLLKSKNGEDLRMKILSSEVIDRKLVLKQVQMEGKNPTYWLSN